VLASSIATSLSPGRAQAPVVPVGSWQPPLDFTGPFPGCAGSNLDFYSIHSSVIPVGPHRGKVLTWDKSGALACSSHNGNLSGDRDQRWAIVDPIGRTVSVFVWTIPASSAPPVYRPLPGFPGITHGAQGLFCAGHCWLPDGRLFVGGGDDWSGPIGGSFAQYTGSRLVCVYNPLTGANGAWSTLPQLLHSVQPQPFMLVPRWYPSVVLTYVPGQVQRTVKAVILGGVEEAIIGLGSSGDGTPEPNNGIFYYTDRGYLTHEAYDIVELSPGSWEITKDTRQGGGLPSNYAPNNAPVPGLFVGPSTASSVSLPDMQLGFSLFYYARAHYLSNAALGGANFPGGLIWSAGMAVDSAWVDHPVAPNVWNPPHPLFKPQALLLEESTAVLLPASLGGGGDDRLALFGGQESVYHTGPITADVMVLDAKNPLPTWSSTDIPPMLHARKFANAVLLPDRSILITGGTSTNPTHGGAGGEVFTPEVFRGSSWQACAAEASPRTYHSGALLLPDARVVTIGGDSHTHDLQVFEPHYFQLPGARPSITACPATIGYSTTFAVSFTLEPGRTLASASLIAPGSVTHSHDPNQRLVELGIVQSTATSATLASPPHRTKAPFGHYMLFLVDSAGAVSAAAWTQLL
jgi:hypothetical protein